MAMITGAEREHNRAALMNAARELLVALGPKASLPAIAEAAGLTTGAIYSIFGSRGAMLVEILEDESARYSEMLDELRDDTLALPEVLHGVARQFLAVHGDQDPAREVAFEIEVLRHASTDDALRQRLYAVKRTEHDRLTGLLADRRIGATSSARTTPAQATRLAITAAALLAGLHQAREQMPDEILTEFVLDAVARLAHGVTAE
jgi:AcrR family transcriptional regulator